MEGSNNKIRWLHLSDFHIGKEGYDQTYFLGRIVEHVSERLKAGYQLDYVFITGDIANRGAEKEYERFLEEFIIPLEVAAPNLLGKLFHVPGNHDIDRNTFGAFDRNAILQTTSPHFEVSEESQRQREVLANRFKAYIENDITGYAEFFNQPEGAYTKEFTHGNQKIAVVGINTSWLCRDDKDFRAITPGKAIVTEALAKVSGADLTIVLGHHPMDWISREHAQPIGQIFGSHHVIYLHGHMHTPWVAPSYTGVNPYLNVQCGASYQAKEGGIDKNGLVWGEVDFDKQTLSVQPWQWNYELQEWKINEQALPEGSRAGQWWKTLTPKRQSAIFNLKVNEPKALPGGWEIQSFDSLKGNHAELPPQEAINFFNGAVPTWRIAISSSINSRRIVGKAANVFRNILTAERPIVVCITSAGCEGKSTALLQAAYEVVKTHPKLKILRRFNDNRPFDEKTILDLTEGADQWLIVLDEVQEADAILDFIEKNISLIQGRIHFLIACRDSTWISSGSQLRWSITDFRNEKLSGITTTDAESIVSAWAAYGDEGLGALANTAKTRRAEILKQYADEEVRKGESGALFGALLLVRHGDDLYDHAKMLVEKLDTIPISDDRTLKDAITYVAIMHAIDHTYLSKEVLQHALNIDQGKFQARVIRPLGEEAAASQTSNYVLTRHKYIAKEILKVLSAELASDLKERYLDLVRSASQLAKSGFYLRDLESWRFKLSGHFMTVGDTNFAIEISEEILKASSSDVYMITYLAKLLRTDNRSRGAVDLFRNYRDELGRNKRSFYFSWGVAESEDSPIQGAALSLFSLSDDCEYMPYEFEEVVYLLSGISEIFKRLHARYIDTEYMDAYLSVCSLLVDCHLHKESADIGGNAQQYKQQVERKLYPAIPHKARIEHLQSAFNLCISYPATPVIVEKIGGCGTLGFDSLTRIIDNIIKLKAR
ncbi:metallophosphoesterase family protein [Pseudomonas sp. P42]|uniref:metallophosphoesterase family protein n=1 Tax=Pseudomonas sp. P42 TaxID=1080160 RepID=UPI001B3230DA|nr:metallophosphoesterase [Pseudomonas sp. P42]MBP5949367.1 metallophosphoesterase [Pseudomonas sp. P42]